MAQPMVARRGRKRQFRDDREEFAAKWIPSPSTGCWVWTACRIPDGYGKTGGQKLAHRASWELHRGPIPAGMSVLHRCDNPPCVNPDHLFLGTQADNNRDRTNKGRSAAGERHGCHKLTADQVIDVRARLARGESVKDIAMSYGVVYWTVYRIKRGITWKTVA